MGIRDRCMSDASKVGAVGMKSEGLRIGEPKRLREWTVAPYMSWYAHTHDSLVLHQT